MTRVRFRIRFGNGLPEDAARWAVPGKYGFLDFGEDKMRISNRELPVSAPFSPDPPQHGVSLGARGVAGPNKSVYGLTDLRFLAYEDAGTKSNVGALAVFGVLGLGARKHWTLMTAGFPDRDAQFLIRAPAHEVRGLLQQAAATSPSLDSIIVEGPPPSIQHETPQRSDQQAASPLDEVERLARLYQDGLLTQDEFSKMKKNILNEL